MPQQVRQALGLQAGDKVDFVPDESGGFKVIALHKDVTALRGRFAGRARHPVSVTDMQAAVQAEAAARAGSAAGSRAVKVRRSR